MDNLDSNFTESSDNLSISESIKNNLITAAKWCKFLSIMGFIGSGFMVLAAFFIFVAAAQIPMLGSVYAVMGVVYLVFAVVFIFPTLNLLRYSNQATKSFKDGSQAELERAIGNLKGFFKFMGIYTIVLIGAYLLFVCAAVILRF